MVDSLEASLRYPMDFTFHIQNFTTAALSKTVKPKQQATVAYSFTPADAFAGRPIGLTIQLNYRDAAGNFFIDPVFNETVQIVEFDEGFDTETFFMYVCLAGAIVLLLFLGFNLLSGEHCHPGLIAPLSQAKRAARPRWWRLAPTRTTVWTTSGSRSPPCATPRAAGRPAPGSGGPRLVLTLTRGPGEEGHLLQGPGSLDTQPATHIDYLQRIGHCIWILDLPFFPDSLPGRRPRPPGLHSAPRPPALEPPSAPRPPPGPRHRAPAPAPRHAARCGGAGAVMPAIFLMQYAWP
jgi:hypothetical protein